MTKKIRPLDKTVVTNFTVQVVDVNVRLKSIAAAVASRVPEGANLVSADYTVTDAKSALLNNITTLVIIHTQAPVLISMSNASGELRDMLCTDVFMFYGALDSVEVKPASINTPVRITYLCA